MITIVLESDAVSTIGEVLSMFMVAEVDVLLPALSTAVPVTVWLAPSLPKVTGSLHDDMPERLSEHEKLTVTSELFQPLEF